MSSPSRYWRREALGEAAKVADASARAYESLAQHSKALGGTQVDKWRDMQFAAEHIAAALRTKAQE